MKCNHNMEDIPTGRLMVQIMHMVMKRSNELLEQWGLKNSQAGILFMLHCAGEMSQREMAARIRVTPPSITAAIQKMEKQGYIQRKPDEKDQRVMRLSLTEQGTACVEHVKSAMDTLEKMMFQYMSQEERLLFRRLLLQMQENLKGESSEKRDGSRREV